MIVDFQKEFNGLDVAEFFSGERELWEFWEFFNRLSDGGFTKSAIANDPEVAEQRLQAITEDDLRQISDMRAKGGEENVPLTGYTLTIEKMNQLIDAVNLNTWTIRGMFANKKGQDKFKPATRPKTIFEKKLDKLVYEYEEREQKATMAEFGF